MSNALWHFTENYRKKQIFLPNFKVIIKLTSITKAVMFFCRLLSHKRLATTTNVVFLVFLLLKHNIFVTFST